MDAKRHAKAAKRLLDQRLTPWEAEQRRLRALCDGPARRELSLRNALWEGAKRAAQRR